MGYATAVLIFSDLRIAREYGVSAFPAQLFRVSACRNSPQCGGC
jgi:hypothetical protein